MKEVVIVGISRTAVGTLGGALKDVHAADLCAAVIKDALRRSGVAPEFVDDVIVGSVGQFAENAFVSRVAALRAGLPHHTNAYNVNRLCGSGLQAINSASQAVRSGEADIVVAAGVENMSQFPYYVRKGRYGYSYGHGQLEDGLLTALSDPFGHYPMGVTAEKVSERFGISREEQDEFAYQSQLKAIAAIDAGKFKSQIVPIEVPQRKGAPLVFDTDEYPRRGSTLEKLSTLKPVFQDGGTVTAGNASGINDGAAAVVIMSAEKAEQLRLKPLAYVREQAVSGIDPQIMGFAPADTIRAVLKKAGMPLDRIDLFELNEAFAAQAVAIMKSLDLDAHKVNVNGGAIALGHPIGATGTILSVKLISVLHDRNARYGIVSLCIGGGQGIATIIEKA